MLKSPREIRASNGSRAVHEGVEVEAGACLELVGNGGHGVEGGEVVGSPGGRGLDDVGEVVGGGVVPPGVGVDGLIGGAGCALFSLELVLVVAGRLELFSEAGGVSFGRSEGGGDQLA